MNLGLVAIDGGRTPKHIIYDISSGMYYQPDGTWSISQKGAKQYDRQYKANSQIEWLTEQNDNMIRGNNT